jgi:hypothetical protein
MQLGAGGVNSHRLQMNKHLFISSINIMSQDAAHREDSNKLPFN